MGTFPHCHNPSARQDCFVFERHQVVFYCNFSSSRHVSKSANLIGRIVFLCGASNQKNEPEALKKKWRFYALRFSCRCAHSHWRPLFSQEALNVGEYRTRNSSRCVQALSRNVKTSHLRYNKDLFDLYYYSFPNWVHVHFLSLERIFHVQCDDDASYVRFRETKDKYLNRSLRHGTEIRHRNLRSDSVRNIPVT